MTLMTNILDEGIAAAFWKEKDGWRGWEFNEEMNRYFFNDIPEDTMTNTYEVIQDMQGVINLE